MDLFGKNYTRFTFLFPRFYNISYRFNFSISEHICLDILYGKILFDGKEHLGAFYGFPELENIAENAYKEKFSKDLILDFSLTKKQKEEIRQSLAN